MTYFYSCLLLFSVALASLASAAGPAARVGDFTLLDHQGKSHQLSYYGDHKAVVIVTHGNDSPIVRASLPELAQLADQYAQQGVAFFMLNPRAQDERHSIAQDALELKLNWPVLVDEAQLVAQSLGVDHIGQALIIAPASMTLAYRGPISAGQAAPSTSTGARSGPLRSALSAVLAGEPLSQVQQQADRAALGASVRYESSEQLSQHAVSYTKDIVPILTKHCVSCHHEGGIGPWSMSSHNMIRGWSAMMREVLMTRRMPPGQIDPHVGKPLQEVAGLSVMDQQKLVHWIDAGAPKDGDTDPLTQLTFDNPKFSLGEPDLVFKVPAQSIPATGVLDYRYVPVELNLDEDVWVQAMEFVPGDRQVLHHVIAYLSSPADKTVKGRATGSARGDSVGGFAPGRQPDAFRDNSGRLIRKGSNLLLQMHYTTSGKATVDETEVGLYLHDQPPTYVMAGGVAGQRRFLVPPHAKEYKLEGEQLIEREAYLYSMTPHMHFRGKYMRYSAYYPDGTSELLLSVPKYDFNWQFSYQLQEPLLLPAGTRLVASGAMDNSDRNPSNPDPSKPIHFGLQTKHEMFFGFTTLRYVGDTPNTVTGTQPEPTEADSDDVAGR